MNDSKISVRYAKALFGLAKEKDVLEDVREDMNLLSQTIVAVPEFKAFLGSPIVRTADKKKLFDNVFGSRFNPITTSFLKLLLANKRESFIEIIVRNFMASYRELSGLKLAELTSASALDETTIEQFKKLLKKYLNTEAELNYKVNSKLIGGFILRIEDRQIDASVATKLERLRRELLQPK